MPSALHADVRADLGRVKGIALGELLAWFEQELGRARLLEVVKALPEPVRAQLGLDLERASMGILASRWYSGDATFAVLETISSGLNPAERTAMIDRCADAVISRTLRGVYRLMFDWLATPERYATFAHRVWGLYYDTGEMNVVIRGDDEAECTIRDWRSHHPLGCDMNRAAAIAIYREMGCLNVTSRRECCVAEGAGECRFVTQWTGRRGT